MFRLVKLFKKQSLFALMAVLVILFVFQNTQILLAATPTVVTGSASTITKTTAELNGSITDNGGEIITEAGFEYGLTNGYGSSIIGATSYAGSEIGTAADFVNPYDVALDSSGNIYIADSGNHRIQKFNSAGVFQMMFGWGVDTGASAFETCTASCQAGLFGAGNGQFSGPTGVVIDSSGNIYVVDQGNNRIQKFNSSAVYQSQFGSNGSGNGQFQSPYRLDVDSLGNIFVVDSGNSRIQKFNSAGVYQSQFGTSGSGDGEFDTPVDIALDSANNIFVLDSNLNRIQKFNSAGVYQSQFGTSGGGNGEFSFAYGLAVDSLDNIFVADNGNARIQKFNSSGVYQSQFGSGVSASPVGIEEYSGDIYVSETNSNDVIIKFAQSVIDPTEITGLTCGTTYHFRAYAVNSDGTSYGSDNTFTTSACEGPNVDTKAATNISTASATLNGFDLIINDVSIADVDRGFQYGFTSSYGQTVSETTSFITTFGSNLTFGADMDSSGNIYSALNNYVQKYSSSGASLFQFGSAGTGDGQLDGAYDLQVDSTGNIFVADSGNSRVQKFNSAGVYQSQFGTVGTGNGQFGASGLEMVLDSADNIYVVDSGNSRVQKFNSAGVYQSQFGTVGTGNGQFTNPDGVGMDSSGNIYVGDYPGGLSGRIQKFNSAGVYISDFFLGHVNYIGDEGIYSIFFDIDGSAYITGENSSGVLKLDSSGDFVTEFISGAEANFSVLLDSQNDIYIGVKKYNRNFSANVSSLKCGETYHYRAFATNADGTDYGDDMTFVTAPCSGGGGPTPIYGCTNPTADNYNSSATVDDGSCLIFGCTDRDASNFDPTANVSIDDYCIYDPGAIPGCTDPAAGNYDLTATVDDGSCLYGVFGCTDSSALNFNSLAEHNDGSCLYPEGGGGGPSNPISGCTNSIATNFNSSATIDDGSCSLTTAVLFGCTDEEATNFNSDAETDDGSCIYGDNPGGGVIGEVIGGFSGVVKEIPEEILTGVSVVGLVAPTLILNFLQPGLIIGLLIRLWNLIPILMGYKRKKRPWGTVYDSVTKQPLDPVYVTLNDMSGAEQGSSITDLDGRYGFLAEAGTYTLSAQKDNYVFPSTKIAGKSEDDLYDNLYFGGPVTLEEKEGVIFKNIPMDALNFNWNEFAKAENKKLMKFYSKRDLFFARIANTLFVAGLLSSVALFFVNSSVINTIVLSLYALILVLRIFGVKPKQAGRAYDSDGTPLSFGILRLFSAALQKEVAHAVVGKTGKYYMLVPNGEYYMRVSKKTGEDSYQEVLTTGEFRVSGGYVNKKISI